MLFKSLRYGDIDTKEYDVYISGDAVFNSPARDVEMIEIPGRNGAYALDKRRYKNIDVTYPAGLGTKNEAEFRRKIEDLRNALSSKVGYQRLEDDYNGEEYRLAVYKSGLDVNPTMLRAGQFDIVFDCKPQRFLKSGEIETPVTSGGIITNPTLFESHPLILVDGYGEFDINGEPITIQQGAVMGETILKNGATQNGGFRLTADLDSNNYLEGDIITVGGGASFSETYKLKRSQIEAYHRIKSVECTSISSGYEPIIKLNDSNTNVVLGIKKTGSTNFTAGTDSTNGVKSATFSVVIYNDVTGTDIETVGLQVFLNNLDYSASAERITIGGSGSVNPTYFDTGTTTIYQPQISVNSSVSVLGQLYIDLDIGECYRIEDGQIISINTATILPADLPTLKPGDNVITYDNTFTSFKVTPRWWRV